ncbi:MAG: flavodoxin domain-containing protein, partial [Alistipes sp.]|nr:flavodoxin domain-containing protein [Alistipes sp.]
MEPTSIRTLLFSPTGTTRRVTAAIAQGLGGPIAEIDLTRSAAPAMQFAATDVAILAAPVYSGRIPAIALERMAAAQGNGTPAVIVAVYGNRAFDGAAAELAAWAEQHGFRPVAAAAFIGE